MYTATIPGLAGKTMLTDLEQRRTAYGLNAREAKAYGILTRARVSRMGVGTAWKVQSDDVDSWLCLIDEALDRWEMAGGNGNPFAVERVSQYAAERRAFGRAFDRLANAKEGE